MNADPFACVPVENKRALELIAGICHAAIFECGHPRGGCKSHCDRFVKILELVRERLVAEDSQ